MLREGRRRIDKLFGMIRRTSSQQKGRAPALWMEKKGGPLSKIRKKNHVGELHEDLK